MQFYVYVCAEATGANTVDDRVKDLIRYCAKQLLICKVEYHYHPDINVSDLLTHGFILKPNIRDMWEIRWSGNIHSWVGDSMVIKCS